ncbi:MAG: hypothetical protein ACI89Z_000836 [Porticoccus sp.]|jgi:hypothetical protein
MRVSWAQAYLWGAGRLSIVRLLGRAVREAVYLFEAQQLSIDDLYRLVLVGPKKKPVIPKITGFFFGCDLYCS